MIDKTLNSTEAGTSLWLAVLSYIRCWLNEQMNEWIQQERNKKVLRALRDASQMNLVSTMPVLGIQNSTPHSTQSPSWRHGVVQGLTWSELLGTTVHTVIL